MFCVGLTTAGSAAQREGRRDGLLGKGAACAAALGTAGFGAAAATYARHAAHGLQPYGRALYHVVKTWWLEGAQ